jgi:hypothetical protein
LKDDFEQYIPSEMSATGIVERWFAARLSPASFDNVHFQWQAGYLSDEGWEMQRRTLHFFLKNEPMGRFAVEKRDLYRRWIATLCIDQQFNTRKL